MAKLNPRTGISSQSRSAANLNIRSPLVSDSRYPTKNLRAVNAYSRMNLKSLEAANLASAIRSYTEKEAKEAVKLRRARYQVARDLKLGPWRRYAGWAGDLLDIYDLWKVYGQPAPQIGAVNNPAWTLAATCTGIRPEYMTFSTASTVPMPTCLVNVYPGTASPDFTLAPGPTMRSAYTWQYNTCVPGGAGVPWSACADIGRRYSRAEVYLFSASPGALRKFIVNPMPRWLPNYRYDPLLLPINQPVPLLKPVPARYARRVEKRNNRLFNRAQPQVRQNPLRDILVTEGLFPYPGARVQVYPKREVLDGTHRFTPPPKYTKERKFIFTPHANSVVGLLANGLGETADFVNAVYKALPRDVRPYKRIGALEKASLVYKHFDRLDVQQALLNVVYNQIEDAIYGRIGRAVGRSHRRFFESTGYNSPLHGRTFGINSL